MLSRKVIVWDGAQPNERDLQDALPVLWRLYDNHDILGSISIPELVEENASALRSRYLAWVYELGETVIDRKRLVDHLELRADFSYWWMTLIAEKCNYAKSPLITDAIYLFAFDDWAQQIPKITSIKLVSANKQLHECFEHWCKVRKIYFESQVIAPASEPKSVLRRTFDSLPNAVQAGVWLLNYLINRWPLRSVGVDKWRQAKSSVTFVSYMDNLVPEAVRLGKYESRYWGDLPQQLRSEGCEANWLHIYSKDMFLSDARKASGIINAFNSVARGTEAHVTLDAFLSIQVIAKTIKDFFRLVKVSRLFKGFVWPSGSEVVNIWPLIVNDWKQSMRGQAAIANMLQYNLFLTSMNSLLKQRLGVYLQENQGWEFGFIHAWKAGGHGRLVGCPHSTVRFWDLRYFFDPRSYLRASCNPLPLPDCVAVNGKAATEAYLVGGYPMSDLVEVEALRYQYLEYANTQQVSSSSARRRGLRLLVFGDYLPSNTRFQMELLNRAAAALPKDMVIIVKAHPNCPIEPSNYHGLSLQINNESIAKLLDACDVAYVSAVTSAAVDAYCAGVPVISVLDQKLLNLSPLRGCDNVRFVSTSDALAQAIESASSLVRNVGGCRDFFTLDGKLPRWKQLIEREQMC